MKHQNRTDSDYDTRQRVIKMAAAIMEGSTDEELHDSSNINHNEELEIKEAHRVAGEYEKGDMQPHVRLGGCRAND